MKMFLIFNLIFDFILPISGEEQIICQHDYGTISCDVHSLISIVSSVYGRLNETTCAIGYTIPGDQCTIDSTDWLRQRCENIQSCTLRPAEIGIDPCPNKMNYITAAYECIDTDECTSSPCQNSGICNDDLNSYTCTCAPGYAGGNCQTSNELFSVHYIQHVHIQSHELELTHAVRSRIQCARICSLDYVCYGFKYSLTGATCQTFSRATVSSNTTTYYV